ncbi:MAG: hypothetical protein DDT30_00934 [Dehalococcoidia bacterium]|nr:hypothetical protein [Bacillota bacterium]MBT9142535.1 hypothetical protein [Bacillota bacterium]
MAQEKQFEDKMGKKRDFVGLKDKNSDILFLTNYTKMECLADGNG